MFPSAGRRNDAKITVLLRKHQERRCRLSLMRIVLKVTTLKSLWRNKEVMSLFARGVDEGC